ncbi:MAG: hypothetical protein NUW08_01835 [Candidatus Uhrbacteria bacterium]|nr:hypothetical protein [Candidatus Uhrbacteria bacterium]
MTHNSTVKASIVTVVFAAFGVAGLLRNDLVLFPELAILYLLLLAHTFLSVRCFSALIDPKDKGQIAIDLVLVACYLMLGLTVKTSEFLVWWLVLFLFAAVKYALLVGRFHYPILLRRKLLADLSGLGLGLFAFFIPFYEERFGLATFLMAVWLIVGLFAAGTIYYFFVRPLYVPDKLSAL